MYTHTRLMPRWVLFLSAVMLLAGTLACSLVQPDIQPDIHPTITAAVPPPDDNEPATANTKGPTSTPESTDAVPTNEDPVTVAVNADGSGDYATLEEAMTAVPAGSRIVLGAGSFVLTEAIDRTTAVTLEGAGMDATDVSCAAPDYVLHFSGVGSLTLRGLTLQHTGSAAADVLWVDAGALALDDVRVSGAVTAEDGDSHAGVRLSGSATGEISSSEATGNDLDGFRLEDDASATIEDCLCTDNQQTGIQFRDAGSGSVMRTTCSGNGANGMALTGTSRAAIEDSRFDANEESGLVYFDAGAGTALNNEMTGNGLHGISVNDDAQPTLEGNICTVNAEDGIVYFEGAGGTARGNTCSDNGLHGIGVTDEAAPLLEENFCGTNEEIGIRYSGTSGGTARANQITGNGLSGMVVRDDAAPVIENNVCNDNVESGIAYFGSGAGLARDNDISGNALHGVDIYDTGTPFLESNVIVGNGEAGIRISGNAAPKVLGNSVERNGLSGIIIREQAWPSIEDNWVADNMESGLIYFGTSAGRALANQIEENGMNGLSVNDEAVPVIEENIFSDNVESGVAYFETAAGILQTNTMTGNKWGIYVSSTANPAIGNNTVQDNETNIDDRRPVGQRPTPPPAFTPVVPATTVPPDDGMLFFDDFTWPDPGWWGGTTDAGEVWFEDGELRMLNWTESEFAMDTQPDQWLGDVAITVESRLVDGSDDNWHDVLCRRESADAYYLVGYSADGYVKMLAKYGGDLIYYLDIVESSVVKQGTDVVNTMQLICDGSTITFRLNGQLIGEFTDDVLTEGDIGLSVSSLDGEYSDVAFDNLVVVTP